MPSPTPGELCYAAYWRVDAWTFDVPWAQLTDVQRAAWEAAAQAVLALREMPCSE